MSASAEPLKLPLQALARRVRVAAQDLPFARMVGRIRTIGPSSLEISGLSHSLRIASLVEVATAMGPVLGEVIRLDRDLAHCKLYEARASVALSDPVHLRGELLYYPDDSWRGRIIDALRHEHLVLGVEQHHRRVVAVRTQRVGVQRCGVKGAGGERGQR